MMKKSDLYREWARVLDMCEGTGILTKNAWKFEGRFIGSDTPVFIEGHDGYEFAIAILEGKPVFVGDRIWLVRQQFWTRAKTGHLINDDVCSWNPPKKTFMLNGVELPAPIRELPRESWNSLNILEINDNHVKNFFYFDTEHDRNKVLSAIIKLLEDVSK